MEFDKFSSFGTIKMRSLETVAMYPNKTDDDLLLINAQIENMDNSMRCYKSNINEEPSFLAINDISCSEHDSLCRSIVIGISIKMFNKIPDPDTNIKTSINILLGKSLTIESDGHSMYLLIDGKHVCYLRTRKNDYKGYK